MKTCYIIIAFFLLLPNLLDAQDPKSEIRTRNIPTDSNILVVLNNKIAGTIREIKNLDNIVRVDDIKSVNILKDSSAIAKYGQRGSHGVIEITSKDSLAVKITPGKTDDGDALNIFQKVEESAYPKNGQPAFLDCIQNNLDSKLVIENGAPDGKYVTTVQLLIDTSGNVVEAKPMTMNGYGMEEEAVRVVKKCSNWVSTYQNGRKVKSYKKVEVEFTIPAVSTLDGFMVEDPNAIFEKVDVDAAFPGGMNGWRKFLENNLNPSVPVQNGAPAGKYTVMVQFLVDKTGTVSDIKPLSFHGFGMEKEVTELIRKSPKWEPAMVKGRPVKAYRRQPVVFMVIDEGRKFKNKNKN